MIKISQTIEMNIIKKDGLYEIKVIKENQTHLITIPEVIRIAKIGKLKIWKFNRNKMIKYIKKFL